MPLLFGSALDSGTLLNCAGQGRVGFVTRTDMAEALASALSRAASLKPAYAITTARRAYSLEEVAATLGKAKGKTVKYVSTSPEDFRGTLAQYGVPQGAIDFSVGLGEPSRRVNSRRRQRTWRACWDALLRAWLPSFPVRRAGVEEGLQWTTRAGIRANPRVMLLSSRTGGAVSSNPFTREASALNTACASSRARP